MGSYLITEREVMFNPQNFTASTVYPCKSEKVFFSKNENVSQNYCWVFSEYKRHLTHKRGLDVIVLNNDVVVIVEFNDDGDIVVDTSIVPLKEIKARLDHGDSVVSLCELVYTEIVVGASQLLDQLRFLSELKKEKKCL